MTTVDYGATHRAIVLDVGANGVTVEIPTLAPNAAWGPIPTCVPHLATDEAVLVAQIGTSRDTLVVIGRVPGRSPTISEINNLYATITALQNADTSIQTAAATLASRVTTAENNITTNTGALTSQATRLTTAEGTIASQGTRLTTAETNITTNTNAISTHTHPIDFTQINWARTVHQKQDYAQNNANGGTAFTSSLYLTLPVVANAHYALDSEMIYDALPGVDIKIKFNAPAGSGLRLTPWCSNGPNIDSPIFHDAFDGFEFVAGGKTGGGMMTCRPGGWLVVGGAGGNLVVQIAQNVANAAYSVLKGGSKMRLHRLNP